MSMGTHTHTHTFFEWHCRASPVDQKQQQDAVGTADKAAVPWRAGLGPRMSFSLDDEAVLFQVCSMRAAHSILHPLHI